MINEVPVSVPKGYNPEVDSLPKFDVDETLGSKCGKKVEEERKAHKGATGGGPRSHGQLWSGAERR